MCIVLACQHLRPMILVHINTGVQNHLDKAGVGLSGHLNQQPYLVLLHQPQHKARVVVCMLSTCPMSRYRMLARLHCRAALYHTCRTCTACCAANMQMAARSAYS
jgi:hypothetical protein